MSLPRPLTRALCYITGIIILSLGVALIVQSSLGIGAWEAFNIGLNLRFGIPVAAAYFISGGVLVLVNAYMTRTRPDLSALATTCVIGLCVNAWMWTIEAMTLFDAPTSWFEKISEFLLGLILTSNGVAIYLVSHIGRSPVDGFMFAIAERLRLSLALAKTIDGAIGLLLALLCGGPIGVGTIAFTLLLGPLIDPQYRALHNWLRVPTPTQH